MSPEPRVLISRNEIEETVKRLAAEIKRDYEGRCPVLIGILKGSFIFMADLTRHLDLPVQVDFVRLSSYGAAQQTSGKVRMVQGLRCPVEGRNVLVVEDIIDTGLSVARVLDYIGKKKPASLKLCALTDKPSRRQVPVKADYVGFTVPDRFLVGYGLDLDEKFRNLPDICTLEDC